MENNNKRFVRLHYQDVCSLIGLVEEFEDKDLSNPERHGLMMLKEIKRQIEERRAERDGEGSQIREQLIRQGVIKPAEGVV